MKFRDELFKNFSEATAPRDTYAPTGATSPSNETFPAAVPRAIGLPSELPSLFGGENTGPPSNLPERVSAAEIKRQNSERGDNVWTGDGDEV